MEKLDQHYQNYDEDSRLIKDNSHRIEFITTTHVLDSLIIKKSNIIELGAATGRYSFHYAEQGHHVTAFEKVKKHIDIMRSRKKEKNIKIDILQGDARDLSDFKNNFFDVVLCFGPYYHLPASDDRKKVISECLRVLKPGGIMALAYVNRYAQYAIYINRDKNNINDDNLRNILEKGTTTYGDDSDCFYFSTYSEIESLMENYKIEKVDHLGTDGIVNMMRDKINAFKKEEFKKWLDYNLKTCRNKSLIGYSRHALYVCKKL